VRFRAVHRITADAFADTVKIGESKIDRVRKESEYAAEHVDESYNRPLANINDWIKDIDPKNISLHCQGGYRSMMASIYLTSARF
jgi:rhodanese-related sulfurtransferase